MYLVSTAVGTFALHIAPFVGRNAFTHPNKIRISEYRNTKDFHFFTHFSSVFFTHPALVRRSRIVPTFGNIPWRMSARITAGYALEHPSVLYTELVQIMSMNASCSVLDFCFSFFTLFGFKYCYCFFVVFGQAKF